MIFLMLPEALQGKKKQRLDYSSVHKILRFLLQTIIKVSATSIN